MSTPSSAQPLQKLVTIYLENLAYGKGKMLIGSLADKHGLVEEHLSEFLEQGWRVVSFQGFGGCAESVAARGWITVLLEKPASA